MELVKQHQQDLRTATQFRHGAWRVLTTSKPLRDIGSCVSFMEARAKASSSKERRSDDDEIVETSASAADAGASLDACLSDSAF